jgi:two-component system KDP operon response regulator KdpE
MHLTPKGFDLLHYLMSQAGLPIRHGRFLNAVWGSDYGDEMEYLRSFVSQLPKKIEDEPGAPKYLLTDVQIGDRFRDHDLVRRERQGDEPTYRTKHPLLSGQGKA